MIGYKYHKIVKELHESGYLSDLKCEYCNGNITNPTISIPYRSKDVHFWCNTCDSKLYFSKTDILYYYKVYDILNRMVGNNLKPGECKNITDIYANMIVSEYKEKIKTRYKYAFRILFIIGIYALWSILF